MKKLIAGSMAVLLAAPAFAGGQMYEQQTTRFMGWDILPYVALRGGATYGNLNYRFNDTKKSTTQNLYQLRAALGLTMYETARFEIEGSFFTKGKDTKNFGAIDDVKVTSENIELMANAYMNIGHFRYIQPFAGLGAGMAFIETRGKIPGYAEKRDNTRFSGMATLGLAMPFGCYSVDVAARYNYIDVASGMHDFSGDIGIRYMF
ncbi:MAG: outer membrane beta-barrel protein [Alphaproteobacteria bacterium]|nr:outer membrane beta-barrel protein [Alphaproteobacteria bacterium]MBR0212888.1 outer membrane beta-barrel protein [Alphaproteobacteria bacterium]